MDEYLRKLERDGDREALERALSRIGRYALLFTGPAKPPEVLPVRLPREIRRAPDPAHGGRHNYEPPKKYGKTERKRARRREGRASCRNWEELD